MNSDIFVGKARRFQVYSRSMRALPPETLAAAISTHEPHSMASTRTARGTKTRCNHKKTSNVFADGSKTDAAENAAVDLVWTRCAGGACFGTAKPSDKILTTFRAGTPGQLRFISASGQAVAIPVSWRGLDQALAVLKTK